MTERLDTIRKRLEADANDTGPLIRHESVYGAELLTHAREDIPWLLAEIERLKGINSERWDSLQANITEKQYWRKRIDELEAGNKQLRQLGESLTGDLITAATKLQTATDRIAELEAEIKPMRAKREEIERVKKAVLRDAYRMKHGRWPDEEPTGPVRKKLQLRLLLFEDCNRRCAGCCNKDWDLSALPVVDGYADYDLIMLTGGEPLLRPDIIRDTVKDIRSQTDAKIIVYTAMAYHLSTFLGCLRIVDGITLTLHTQPDAADFTRLCTFYLAPHHVAGKSMRLNVFKGVTCAGIPAYWQVKKDIEWIKNCPLPEGEVFKRLGA